MKNSRTYPYSHERRSWLLKFSVSKTALLLISFLCFSSIQHRLFACQNETKASTSKDAKQPRADVYELLLSAEDILGDVEAQLKESNATTTESDALKALKQSLAEANKKSISSTCKNTFQTFDQLIDAYIVEARRTPNRLFSFDVEYFKKKTNVLFSELDFGIDENAPIDVAIIEIEKLQQADQNANFKKLIETMLDIAEEMKKLNEDKEVIATAEAKITKKRRFGGMLSSKTRTEETEDSAKSKEIIKELNQIARQASNQNRFANDLNTFRRAIQGKTFRHRCEALDAKPKHWFEPEEQEQYSAVVDYLNDLDQEYQLRKKAQQSRDYETFGNGLSTIRLPEVILDCQYVLSPRAKLMWRAYVVEYEVSKALSENATGLDEENLDQYFWQHKLDDYKLAASTGAASPGVLLALEGHLRALRYKLERLWIREVLINRVALEMPEDELKRLPSDIVDSLLSSVDLKKESKGREPHRLPFSGQKMFSPGMDESINSIENQKRFRQMYTWLSEGPDSDQISEAIQAISQLREKHTQMEWPKQLQESYFKSVSRPIYQNPFTK